MPLDIQGIIEAVSLGTESVVELYPYLRELFVNETPLVARLPRAKASGPVYDILSYDVRPRTYTLNAAFTADAADIDITLTDATPLLVGDVLEVFNTAASSVERVEVVTLVSGTVVNVRRARESTTVLANTAGGSGASLVVTLIGNSRTGAEIDQQAKRSVRTATEQYVQTYQFPVQVGGLANAIRNIRLPAGFSDLFTMEQKVGMTEMMRDEEYSSYYGLGEKPASPGDRAKQKGLKKQILAYNSGSNVTLSAGGSYTKLNFVAALQKAFDGGGNPDVCICSTNFMSGLATWSVTLQQFAMPRMNALGIPITEYYAPFLGGPVTFVPSLQLKAGTALIATSSDLLMREIRPEFWAMRGRRGDAVEGDMIADVCVEAGHPSWHSWVEGITSFA